MAHVKQKQNSATSEVVDKQYFGRRITYSVAVVLNDKNKSKILSLHNKLVFNLSPAQREQIKGRQLTEIMNQLFHLSAKETDLYLANLKDRTFSEIERPKVEFKTPMQIIEAFINSKTFLHKKSERHIRTCTTGLNNLIGYFSSKPKKASDLSREDLVGYASWRKSNRHTKDNAKGEVHSATINKELGLLKQALDWAREEKLAEIPNLNFDHAYVEKTASNTKTVEALSIKEQKQLLFELWNTGDFATHDAILLYLITGIRFAEIFLFKKNAPIEHCQKLLLHSESDNGIRTGGKTASAVRSIPLHPTARQILTRGFIYEISQGFNRDYLKTKLQRLYSSKKISIKVHIHKLRHTYCTNNLISGEDAFIVSKQMGHSTPSLSTSLYSKSSTQRLVESSQKEYQEHLLWLQEGYFNSKLK